MARVLVIDDNASVRETLRLLLENGGLTVEEAPNGREGLARARQAQPDLILCDLTMPVMDGMETLSRVRSDPELKRIPFVVISGNMGGGAEQAALSQGADSVLPKPFKWQPLMELVHGHLARM